MAIIRASQPAVWQHSSLHPPWLVSLSSLATEYRGEVVVQTGWLASLPSLATEYRGEVVVQTGWSAFPPWLQSAEGRWWYRLAGQPSLPGYRVQRGGGGTDWLVSLPSLATEGRWWHRLAGQPSLPGYRVQRGGGGTDWLVSLPSLATEYRGEVVIQTGWGPHCGSSLYLGGSLGVGPQRRWQVVVGAHVLPAEVVSWGDRARCSSLLTKTFG